MSKTYAGILTVALLATPFAAAQDESTPPKAVQTAEIQELIEQLGDDSYQARKAAERKLIEIGAGAKGALETAAAEHDDTEVQWRARRVLEKIESGAAEGDSGLRRRAQDPERSRELDSGPRDRELGGRIEDMIEELERRFGDDRGAFRDMRRQMDELRRQMARVDDLFDRVGRRGGIVGFPDLDASRGVRIDVGTDGVRVETEEQGQDGERETKVYEAPDLDSFREKYPDVAEKYLGRDGFGFRTFDFGVPGRPFPGLRWDARERPRATPRIGQLSPEVEVPAPPPEGRRLGVYLGELDPAVRTFLGLEGDSGLLVESVQEGSLAEALGIRARDVVVDIAGRKVGSPADVAQALGGIDAGEEVVVEVNRAGRSVTLKAQKRVGGAAKKLEPKKKVAPDEER